MINMKVGLIDVDSSNFPNLALMKISSFYKKRNAIVEFVNYFSKYDIVYKSKIFSFSINEETSILADQIIQGGTGYDLKSVLSPEIEYSFPDYSIYPQYDYAVGYLTRGCSRKCPFCIVNEKEGATHQVANLKDFWDRQRVIKLLDPNILQANNRELLLDQLIESKAYIDFTQGLDIRLFTNDIISKIDKIKIKRIHFAYDFLSEEIENNLKILSRMKKYNRTNTTVYVLVNYNTSIEEDLYRIEFIKSLGFQPYVMIYNKHTIPTNNILYNLSRYVNAPKIFWSIDKFEDYSKKFNYKGTK